MSSIYSFFSNPGVILAFKYLYYSAPVWLSFCLVVLWYEVWRTYQRVAFIHKQTYTLLEIKIPKEIFKSPAAMEFLFNSLYQTFGEDDFKIKWDRWPPKIVKHHHWTGSVRPWFSFEICAIDGKVHFLSGRVLAVKP